MTTKQLLSHYDSLINQKRDLIRHYLFVGNQEAVLVLEHEIERLYIKIAEI